MRQQWQTLLLFISALLHLMVATSSRKRSSSNNNTVVKLMRRVVGGKAIHTTNTEGEDDNRFFVFIKGASKGCGGVLLVADIALTAQHCARDPMSSYTVYTNLVSRAAIHWAPAQDRHSVVAVAHHPGYNIARSAHCDVSVFKLNRPNGYRRLITLDKEVGDDGNDVGSRVGARVTVLGWLHHVPAGQKMVADPSGSPRERVLVVQDPVRCREVAGLVDDTHRNRIGTTNRLPLQHDRRRRSDYHFQPEVEFCVSSSHHPDQDFHIGTGRGDSGGPAIVRRRHHHHYPALPLLVGLVSWANTYPDRPQHGFTALVRVSKFSQWIDRAATRLHRKYKGVRF